MVSPRNTPSTRPSTGEGGQGGSEDPDLAQKLANIRAAADDRPEAQEGKKGLQVVSSDPNIEIVGEMVVTFYRGGYCDARFPKLGLIGPGTLEQALPRMINLLMQARAAEDRRSRGLPEHFNVNPHDAA